MDNKIVIEASAPSNIALIKYMGKISTLGNQPTNSSLSWTIEDLRSFVRVTLKEDLKEDQWRPLEGAQFAPLEMSEKSIERFLKHFQSLKAKFGIQQNFLIESANNFPSDCGLASSASSFAALTLAATEAFGRLNDDVRYLSTLEKAELSRLGSGSSCRSFFGPWSLWFSEGVRPLEFPIHHLLHQVLVVENDKKQVSSSEAHKRVVSSELFKGRPERAEIRLAELMQALSNIEKPESWRRAYEIVWDEFWDMHRLFETSQPPFKYMLPKTMEALNYLSELWKREGDGPLVTMDAGANIHLLYRPDQSELRERLRDHFQKEMNVYPGGQKHS